MVCCVWPPCCAMRLHFSPRPPLHPKLRLDRKVGSRAAQAANDARFSTEESRGCPLDWLPDSFHALN
jgi:hypothetical protein